MNKLSRLRIRAKLPTVQAAATKLACSRVHLLKIESGRAGASDALVACMSATYGIPEELVRVAMLKDRIAFHKRALKESRA